ncbi:MAG: TonB-dependent receptor [Henriciella sp.]|nr:TonB-dependent receptor [Henriciella sp.]MBO6695818.1 TonB-dependent receptor [Henriciella sp.]
MHLKPNSESKRSNGLKLWRAALLAGVALPLGLSATAQDASDTDEEEARQDVIVVQGIRSSLASALNEKRNADNLVEIIRAEDIGKLPDQNLAEVLENVTGVQITRTAGVGTGVQIRGTNANRVEVNGVSSVGSGDGRNGIGFEDVNPAIIAAVEVTKASEAKTIEGSVGGTVNLRTIRPLELSDMLLNVRIQGEDNSLSTEGITPRYSAAFGDNWSSSAGEFGFVITGSYTEQEAVSFRPRTDRDNLASAPGAAHPVYQGIQFLVQEQENDDYETLNIASSFEWAPNDELTLSFDAIINEQERSRDQYRLQASGISNLRNFPVNAPTAFETLDYSAVGGPILQGALAGLVEPDITIDDDDGNLRFTTETGSRVTDSQIFSLGGEWTRDNWTVSTELATSKSDTRNPTLNTTVNFINPNCPLDGAPTGDPSTSNDNCVPFIYDLSGDSLAFGINFNSPFAPTPQQLLDPANVVLDQVDVGRNTTENQEDAFRIDVSYDFTDSLFGDYLTSVDAGFRFNKSSHVFDDIDDRIGGFSRLEDSPSGSLFSELLVPGPTNYGDADGRSLFISNFLLIDPDRSFSDPNGVISILEAALAAHRVNEPQADGDLTLNLSSDQNAFRDISEETSALYAQANFESGIFRGNIGVRYIETEIDSIGFGPEVNGTRSLQSTTGSYDFVLPRFNLVAQPSEDVILRLAYGSDIRRPNFTSLSTGFTFDQSENAQVSLGNPGLEPEEVTSIDVSAEWYFAPSALVSVGWFTKDRTNIFGSDFEGALLIDDGMGGFLRETDPTCPGGGIFNPDVIPNVLGDPNTTGLCVDFSRPGNDPATTTQSGWEFAFQYDLSSFEDRLGWASGFGVVANYTKQEFEGGSVVDTTSGRGLTVLGDLSIPRGLLDFSENAYNATLYYEKYGLSARARYTWREGFRTQDFGGGANTSGSSTLSFPVHTLDRGQLNASVNYAVTDNFSIGLEAVNLTEERIVQKCVTEAGPTCFVGYPDRRITFGGSYTF